MTKARIRSVLALVAIVLGSANLFGWSVEGHQAIATIAQNLLTQAGQFAPVQALLGSLTLAQISTCADELRDFQSGGTAMSAPCQQVFSTPTPPTGTAPWHFVDIPVSLASPTPSDVATACANDCVLTQVNNWGTILADKTQSNALRLQALAFIVHFIGDLHQPLHSSTRGSDAGGNAEMVSIDGGTTSLHHSWDFNLVNDINSDPTMLASLLSAEIAAAQAEPATTPEGWSLQAFQFAQNVAFAGIPTSTGTTTTLSSTYIANATPVVRQQIARAGVRLAAFIANALSGSAAPVAPLPRPDHVVIVMEENHSFADIIGSSQAPFINSLAQQGALFTQSFGVEHPSQPNYLDLFSGTNQGVTDDSCPHTFSTENLGSELAAAGLTFTGFSEDLPAAGSTVCTSGEYAEKHAPWVNFTNVPTSANQPFTSFPTNFTTLPTISIIDPNLLDDMHDGTITEGDTWLQQHLSAYIQFAQANNSLLIVTWDEDDNSANNQIPTIFVGPMVKQGQFAEKITHFNVLRTLEDIYGLTHIGGSTTATAITDVWQQATADFSVTASPASLSITQGSTGSSTISTTVSGGFNSTVSLTVSGLPSGVTAAFNPTSIAAPGSGSSTLTFTAGATATTGTSNVTITATGGGVTHTTTIALTINAAATPDFTLSASPTSLSITQGTSGNSTISTTVSGGFNSAVSLTVSGLPSGVTAVFNPASIAAPGSGSSTLTFTASATATTGTSNVTVTATGGGITDTATITLTIVAAATPDFTVSASPVSLSVTQGTSGSSTISTTVSGGFNSAVSLSASGLPSGVTASFNPASIAAPGSGSSTLTFTASSTATTGTATITVTATGGGVTHTTTIALAINAAATPAFTVSASPASLSVTQGTSGSSTISTTVSGGFNSAVSLSASGLPSGVTASFNPTSIAAPGSGSSTLTFTASSTATTGTATVTVTATGGGVTHTTTISLTIVAAVTPDFAVSASPASLSVTQGTSGSSTISTTVSGGFNSAVSLSASGLPSGVTASFNPASIAAPGSGSSTLTFTASSTATTGTATVTVTATGGGVTHTATISLTIVASSGGGATQLLGNPGFENGSANPAPWTVSTTQSTNRIINSSSAEPPHSGTWDAWLDGHGNTTTDSILQQVTIPSNATAATLSFWLHIDTAETSTTKAFDTMTVQVRNTSGTVLSTLATFSNLNHATGYQQHSFDLTSFKGQTIQIFVQGKEDFELQTSFVLDDMAVNISTGTATELLGNNGFENGPANPSPWVVTTTQSTSRVINSSSAEPPHSGTFDAWLDGHGSTDTDTLMQQVAIPSTVTTATLSFWLHIDTAETTTTSKFDTLTVQVRDSTGAVLQTLATFSNLDAASGYQQHSFNLNGFIGKTVQIFFSGAEDFEIQTSFVIDDVSLQVQ